MINFSNPKNRKLLIIIIAVMVIAMTAPLVMSALMGIL